MSETEVKIEVGEVQLKENVEEVKEEIKEKVEEIKEEIKEKVEELIPDFTNKTIPEMFLIILKQQENSIYCKKIGITISKDVVEIINKIIEVNPQLLSDIEKSVKEVLKDGKIDSNDIPEFMLIIQILYERLYNNKTFKITSKNIIETCSTIVKFVIRTLIEERKIEMNIENKDLFIEQLDKLIDSCMCLLNFDKVLVPKGCNCSIM
jgi:gas vesicle protein